MSALHVPGGTRYPWLDPLRRVGPIASERASWRAVNGAHLVALVRAGATFIDGKLVERPSESPVPTAA
ncbi:hypothetical protein GCM10010156_77530 [Planobispora rosea]|uniref:Uncharacterized protein n=1 Tax=Planobispora rosea TaxID=35762 RepID=A0A8J3S6I0_PLARO|nr:hypothetical protein GCM10010156_77530 [Planobispora rosea]GIH88837.1 hypothetical protein Pro02_72450 [Planobispora rosea]